MVFYRRMKVFDTCAFSLEERVPHSVFSRSNRFALLGSMVILVLTCFPIMVKGAATEDSLRVYFGTYTGPKSKGIYLSRFDPGTGKLSAPSLAAESKNPTFLAVHPNSKYLYA